MPCRSCFISTMYALYESTGHFSLPLLQYSCQAGMNDPSLFTPPLGICICNSHLVPGSPDVRHQPRVSSLPSLLRPAESAVPHLSTITTTTRASPTPKRRSQCHGTGVTGLDGRAIPYVWAKMEPAGDSSDPGHRSGGSVCLPSRISTHSLTQFIGASLWCGGFFR